MSAAVNVDPPRSASSRNSHRAGGTRTASSNRCTKSTRCASTTSTPASDWTERPCWTSAAAVASCPNRMAARGADRHRASTWGGPRWRLPDCICWRPVSRSTTNRLPAEQLAAERAGQFDVVTCMEMLEHVPDPASVMRACAPLVKPGGQVFFSTINRNPKSYLFAIIGAEYLLRMLPQGHPRLSPSSSGRRNWRAGSVPPVCRHRTSPA